MDVFIGNELIREKESRNHKLAVVLRTRGSPDFRQPAPSILTVIFGDRTQQLYVVGLGVVVV